MNPLRQWRDLGALVWTLLRYGRGRCPWCPVADPTREHIRDELRSRGTL